MILDQLRKTRENFTHVAGIDTFVLNLVDTMTHGRKPEEYTTCLDSLDKLTELVFHLNASKDVENLIVVTDPVTDNLIKHHGLNINFKIFVSYNVQFRNLLIKLRHKPAENPLFFTGKFTCEEIIDVNAVIENMSSFQCVIFKV